jgi:hypothetical protein
VTAPWIVSVVGAIVLPLLVMMVGILVKWTRMEDRLGEITDDVRKLVEDKDKVHLAIQQEIRDDRVATDRRLRWLEEHLWKRGNSNAI